MKKFSIILLIIAAFIAFLCFDIYRKSAPVVMNILTSSRFEIDLNNNHTIEDDETVCILDSVVLPNLSKDDILGIEYLKTNFAKEQLLDQPVKVIFSKESSHDCRKAKIFVKGHDYEELLSNAAFDKNLKRLHRLQLRTLNNKSNKYHKLSCKYGQSAHNKIIMPFYQLPPDAKPCKFCHIAPQKAKPHIESVKTILSTGSVKVFLTDLTTVLKPTNKCSSDLCKEIVYQINNTKNTLDFAIYGYGKVPEVQKALENAIQREVTVRMVYDLDNKGENLYPDTLYLTSIIKNYKSDSEKAIMHNKFYVFDNQRVIIGSANLSPTDMSGFNSNSAILINSKEIANIYTAEFNQMYGGSFHTLKNKAPKQCIQLGDIKLTVYFSPQDTAVNNAIIPLINSAKRYIYMPAFLITHKSLTANLINAKKRGVDVRVIIDATNAHTAYSAHELLRKSGIPVKTENYAGKMHSKSLIIDDKYTIIGSMNFSNSGENKNDENLMIIEDSSISMFYKSFFEYVWAKIPDKWLKWNARAESPDSIGSCSDGIDNDFDEKIDNADDSCNNKIKT